MVRYAVFFGKRILVCFKPRLTAMFGAMARFGGWGVDASTIRFHRVFAPHICTGNIQGKLTRGKCLAELKTNVRWDISHKVHLAKFTTLD